MSRKLLLVLTLALLLIPTAALAGPSVVREYQTQRQLAAVRAATAKYHNIDAAIADGYIPTDHCIDQPGSGMGYHFFNPGLGGDLVNDPLKPELLIYVPDGHGGKRLGAVEYFQADMGQAHPTIFGQPFDGPMEGHEPGMPVHYDLHVWLWQHNPDGVFAPWNPSVSCGEAH
jgi:hypothetical protein